MRQVLQYQYRRRAGSRGLPGCCYRSCDASPIFDVGRCSSHPAWFRWEAGAFYPVPVSQDHPCGLADPYTGTEGENKTKHINPKFQFSAEQQAI